MQFDSLDYFFKAFAEEQMNLLYTGDFTDELTDLLIEVNNNQYSSKDELKKSHRKAAFLIAECFQNIVRHNELSNKDSFFHIKNNRNLFSIVSGNSVQNEIIPSLKEQLEQLNQLSSEELKAMYRKTLAEGNFSEKGGAGLGLIEMARKTKNKLNFTFSEIDALKSHFYFRLFIDRPEFGEVVVSKDFKNSIAFRSKMLNDDLFLIYKGELSTTITIPMFGIVEKSMQDFRQKVLFVQFLGFMEKVSASIDGQQAKKSCMLYFGENEDEYAIGASCYLSNGMANSIKRTLKLFEFSDDEPSKEYNQTLKQEGRSYGNSNFDLVEMQRHASKLEFETERFSENSDYARFILRFKKQKRSGIHTSPATNATKVKVAEPSLENIKSN